MNSIDNINRLYAKSTIALIGQDLPEDERIPVEIRPPTLEDLTCFSFKKEGDDGAFLQAAAAFLARTTNVPQESLKKLTLPYLMEILEKVMEGVDVEKMQSMSSSAKMRNGQSVKDRLESLRQRAGGAS
jgi:hypothetical protein